MSYLSDIVQRHGRDGWRDFAFIVAAVLLTALAVGATTSKAVGEPASHDWSVIVVDPDTQVQIR
jgi:hypothetical protein